MNAVTPHPQVVAVSRLWENQANQVEAALDHIRRELAVAGYATQHPMASPDTSKNPPAERDENGNLLEPVTLTSVERAAARVLWLRNQRAQIEDDIRAAAHIAYSLHDTCLAVLGTRINTETKDKPRCWAGDLEGYLLPRFEADGKTLLPEDVRGWSDPLCTNLPRRGNTGPCDACFARHRRYRQRLGLPPLSSEIAAA